MTKEQGYMKTDQTIQKIKLYKHIQDKNRTYNPNPGAHLIKIFSYNIVVSLTRFAITCTIVSCTSSLLQYRS